MSVVTSVQRPVWKMITRELPCRFATGKNRRLAAIVEALLCLGVRVECHFITDSAVIREPYDKELWGLMEKVILWKIGPGEMEGGSSVETGVGITYRCGSSISECLAGEFDSDDLEGVIFTSIESVSSLWKHISARLIRVLECDELESNRLEAFSCIKQSIISSYERRTFVAKGILEREWLDKFDLVAFSSEREIERAASIVSSEEKLMVWPNTAAPPSESYERHPPADPTLFFVGQLGYPPNQDGLLWFLEEVFPLLLEKRPNARLRIVGQRCPDSFAGLLELPGVDFLGYQPDLEPFYSTSTAAIIPLRAGMGTRIKILEAFSHLCPVVSTSKGAEGLRVDGGSELLLADDPESFASCCLSLVEEATLAVTLAKAGRQYWESNHQQESLNQILLDSMKVLRNKRGSRKG